MIITNQPIMSAAIILGEKSNAEWPPPQAKGVIATKRLTQKTAPHTQIVIDFRFMIAYILFIATAAFAALCGDCTVL